MIGIEEVFRVLRPIALLIYGDTNSTLAGALVGAKMGIPIIHVEAGIRSYNRAMAEEVNRIVADTFSSILCCPTKEAVENLRKEGIDHKGVYLTGDVMCDMLEQSRHKIKAPLSGKYYFCTIHRPYNTDIPERMLLLLQALNGLDHKVIFAIHPRTRRSILEMGVSTSLYSNITIIDPVGYIDCLSYQSGASCVITDSGGMQKEAYMLQRKCITLRSETEWNETLRERWNILVYDNIETISSLVHEMPGIYVDGMFGDGNAAAIIVNLIKKHIQ
jgi:UDP-GlcNAc3NAcA epimerase